MAPKASDHNKPWAAEQLALGWVNPLRNSTFPWCHEWVYSQLSALCDSTPDTLCLRGDSSKARNSFEGRQHMSVYIQWSLYGIDLCLQTQGPADSCSRVIALSRSKCEDSTKQIHAHRGRHMVPGAVPLPFCGHTAPFPSSEGLSACQLLASLLVAKCHLSLQTPPSCPHSALCFSGSSQLMAEPQEVLGQALGDLGNVGRVLQEGTCEARGTARPKA